MAKAKTRFFCTECGGESSKWMGKCPGCGEWNTLVEEPVGAKDVKSVPGVSAGARSQPAVRLAELPGGEEMRIPTGIGELDRVLGGGLVPASVVLVGGAPGIGKSTLWLQALGHLAAAGACALYVTAEESAAQIKARAGRLVLAGDSLYVLAQTRLEHIEVQIEKLRPTVVLLDSIQTAYSEGLTSAPGSVTQVRECAARLMRYAKETGAVAVLIGHVTKEGTLAGPRVLEHMVDTVLYFEGERNALRLLRAVKNRFGSTQEIGVFEMCQQGMVEVENPSKLFLAECVGSSGSAVVCTLEGTRPMLAEVQALAVRSSFSVPRRTANGLDYARAVLMAAVLERRGGLTLSDMDLYLNVAGGLRLSDTAADLGVLMAMVSCLRDWIVPSDVAFIGEVGLGGEVRQVSHLQRRVKECARLGYTRVLLPKTREDMSGTGAQCIHVANMEQAMAALTKLCR